jgi:biotin synthase
MNIDFERLGEVRTIDTGRGPELAALPFNDLLFHAQRVHRRWFDFNTVQVSTRCRRDRRPGDCAYCSRARWRHWSRREARGREVIENARRASRGCNALLHGRRLPQSRTGPACHHRDDQACGISAETCCTLGMLSTDQARELKDAGLDYYNHNLDTSPEFYGEIITTRTYQDRLDTLQAVREAGISVCCGGILGMGETAGDRASLLLTLATHADSVPINQLVAIGHAARGGRAARRLRLRTGGRARASSCRAPTCGFPRTQHRERRIGRCAFRERELDVGGDRLLTTGNPEIDHDRRLFGVSGSDRGHAVGAR